MSGLSHQQAMALLQDHPEDYRTPDSLKDLANQVSIYSDGQVTLLYGGMVHKDISSNDLVELMVANKEDIRAINKTPVAAFLQSEDYLEAVAKAHNCKSVDEVLSKRDHPANQFMFAATDGRWADASARFTAATKGEVMTLSGYAGADRTLGLVELPTILKNPEVTHINGKPKAVFEAIYEKTGSLTEVFKAVASSSHDLMRNMEVKASTHVNDDGSEKKIAEKVGSKSLFEGCAYRGTSLAKGEANLSIATATDPKYQLNINEGKVHLDQAELKNKVDKKSGDDAAGLLLVADTPSSRLVALTSSPALKRESSSCKV
ncbi:hypothetical protein ACO0LL_06895 [Undibacterium sp. TC4M20W]|uniref:hypothetical protein n=1 Tax=Undibacterium sp. TC4M20W TaxID=3413052 RepID=UPI003BF35664